ncbi:homogentisate 1,2-dioxygenase [bacterium]|nr:homogentisate 1,2-dioxygenase [bacterium]
MFYHKLGKLPRKRHTVVRNGSQLVYEKLMGQEGFSGVSSLLYKDQLPCSTIDVSPLLGRNPSAKKHNKHLNYKHYKTSQLKLDSNVFSARSPLLENSEVEISVSTYLYSGLFTNSSHHEVYFIEEGEGNLLSEFGVLPVASGDYVVIPKGLLHQWDIKTSVKYLLIQSKQAITFPKRYLNAMGQFLEDSPICERDIQVPTHLDPIFDKREHKILVRRDEEYFEVTLSHHPFDTVGWDGYLYPYSISIHDFEPVVGRIHLPPPVHQIFQSAHFVICNFVPRLYDFHPEAVPAPYYHHNVDSDEVLYYVKGNFMSRSGIEQGSITLHPAGLVHGPQPGKVLESIGKKETNELAVMIDTFQPLYSSQKAENIAVKDYHKSWLES